MKQNIVANSPELRTWQDPSAFTQMRAIFSSNTDVQRSSETSELLSKDAGAFLKNRASQKNALCTSYSLVNSL